MKDWTDVQLLCSILDPANNSDRIILRKKSLSLQLLSHVDDAYSST